MINVLVYGFGAMGSGMGKAILTKKGLNLSAVVDLRDEYQGKDVSEILNLNEKTEVLINKDLDKAIEGKKIDVALVATDSFVETVFDTLKTIMERKINVISIAEEMSYPWSANRELAEKLDEIAKANDVTLLGTGVNPGFVLDTLPVLLTAGCLDVDYIEASRINDLSPFGPTVMKTQGVGLTVEEFEKGIKDGSVKGHIGFEQSVYMIAEALGWKIEKITEKKIPIVSNVYRETPHVKVEKGMVAGCNHTCEAYVDGKVKIRLIHPQQIHPHLENVETGDYVTIKGNPDFNVSNKPECPGGIGTMALAVNSIPHVFKASKGLKTMNDIPVVSAICSDKINLRRV